MVLTRERAKKLSDAAPFAQVDALQVSIALKDWIYKNSIFDPIHKELLEYATSNTPGLVVALTGMRRTQKSTVVKAVRLILEERAVASGKSRGSMIIGVPPFDGNGEVDWKACGRDLLEPMLGELIDKVIPIPPLTDGAVHVNFVQQKKGTAQAFLSAIEDDMRQEGIPLFIDHADFIYPLTSEKRMQLFFARIKRLEEKGGRPIILVGTSGLALLCDLARKWLTIELLEMPCYSTDEKGIIGIAEHLSAFEMQVGGKFCEKDKLKNRAETFARLADGRIGTIMDALKRAFESDCVYGGRLLTVETVEQELKTLGMLPGMCLKERNAFESLSIIRAVHSSNEEYLARDTCSASASQDKGGENPSDNTGPSGQASSGVEGTQTDNTASASANSDDVSATVEVDGHDTQRKRRRRRTRVGRTQQSNAPLHPNGDPEA